MKDRIRKEGFVLIQNLIKPHNMSDEEIENLIDKLNDVDIFGSPESSIVLMVRRYFLLKKIYNPSDIDIIEDLNRGRVKVGFPSCEPYTDLLLDKNPIQKYILIRLRIEEPELWTRENISDEIILKNIQKAINMYFHPDIYQPPPKGIGFKQV